MTVFLEKYGKILFLLISGIIYYHIGYQLIRSNFAVLIFLILFLFLLYYLAVKYFEFNWWIAVIPRLILIASVPSLSDDYFRFIWDGNMVANGINPFQFLPSALSHNNIYEGLNSKNYYSIYPPLLQAIFGISAFVSKGNILTNLICLRIFILLAEIGSIYLMIKLLVYFRMKKKIYYCML